MKFQISRHFSRSNHATIVTGNCIELLSDLPDSCVQLLVTSPPYNVGKEYESPRSLVDYIDFLDEVLRQACRVVSPGGSICWQVGSSFRGDGSVLLIDSLIDNVIRPLARRFDIKLRNRIIWHFEHGLHASRRFSGRYETILWYTKGADYKFNLDAVRVPQKYPGKKAHKGPRAGMFSGHPLGKNPSDFWNVDSDVWHIPNVKSNHVEKVCHPCQFPIDLAARLILALTDPGDVVIDPFGGVGSAAAAAVYLGRRAISIDTTSRYSAIARRRVRDAFKGTLPFRPSGTPMVPPPSTLTVLPPKFATVRERHKASLDRIVLDARQA